MEEGGWDANLNWEDILSLGEQQGLGMARLFFHTPKFGILDVCTNATSVNVEEQLYILAKDLGITIITSSQELEKYSDDNKELAWMFFVDGCVILQAVYMRYERKWRKIHECNPKVHRRYCYQPRRGQGNRLFKEGKFELARAKYENVSNVMLDMFTSRKIKRNLMHWLSQTFLPAKGNYKGTSSSRSGGIGEKKRRT
ncbi:hypothetical protein ES319_A05G332200v1 [Gossypium barbadense]|uniref:Uncharacterized protein n=2 Tax=Gossypium TaxID=3633 RepID=A0A5J5VX47_GOSBA|nr:hypothetical protein ES319_A05G332200v1 [Gossypium barbadense]TYH19428.1 hypothetical protein ES288_A05G351200v1 [Gossypium darwinii]